MFMFLTELWHSVLENNFQPQRTIQVRVKITNTGTKVLCDRNKQLKTLTFKERQEQLYLIFSIYLPDPLSTLLFTNPAPFPQTSAWFWGSLLLILSVSLLWIGTVKKHSSSRQPLGTPLSPDPFGLKWEGVFAGPIGFPLPYILPFEWVCPLSLLGDCSVYITCVIIVLKKHRYESTCTLKEKLRFKGILDKWFKLIKIGKRTCTLPKVYGSKWYLVLSPPQVSMHITSLSPVEKALHSEM